MLLFEEWKCNEAGTRNSLVRPCDSSSAAEIANPQAFSRLQVPILYHIFTQHKRQIIRLQDERLYDIEGLSFIFSAGHQFALSRYSPEKYQHYLLRVPQYRLNNTNNPGQATLAYATTVLQPTQPAWTTVRPLTEVTSVTVCFLA
jgi:hypothetical protein